MNSINNSTSSKSTTGYSSKGFSGLVSGMDTDALVEAMTSDVQAKIDKVKQDQQRNTWKQTAYREVISALTSFQDKYFSYASSTNLQSGSFFNTTTMTANGSNTSAITVTGTSTTSTPTYSITGISKLAKKATMTSGGTLASSNINTGEISFGDRTVCAAADGSIAIKYGNSVYQVNIGGNETALTAADMAIALNDAMKNVTLSTGGSLGDKLQFTTSGEKLSLGYTGEDSNGFSISGGTTATLAALGFEAGDAPVAGIIQGSDVALAATVPFSLGGKSLTFDLNGISKTISFTDADTAKAKEGMASFAQLVQEKLDTSFGAGKISVSGPTDKLSFKTVTGTADDPASVLKITSNSTDTLGAMGVFNLANGTSNRLDTTKKLSELGLTPGTDGKYTININGQSLVFNPDAEIGTVISEINSNQAAGINISYLSTTGRFNITADDSGVQGKVNIYDEQGGLAEALFGEDAMYTPAVGVTPAVTSSLITAGQDLEMTIKYTGSATPVDITRSSNGVTIDGVSFTANSEFTATADSATEISFTPSSSPDKVVDAVKSMVSDFNNLITMLAKYTETKKDRDYAPLTDAQKEDMTTDEIEKWETKAKEGILFGDSTLNSLAASLRFVFSTVVTGYGDASSIGITTSSSYSDNGKITLNEDKLKAAIASDPDKVKSIFTATAAQSASATGSGFLAGGLSTRLKTITEAYAKDTGSYKGKLVDLAGIANKATTADNYISRQQKLLTNRLDYLKDLLKTRQDRYQKQFTNLETYISKMNSQSSWLTSSTS